MDLNTVCFGLFAFLFTGYLVLEGFGYGAGMLLPFLGRSEDERRAIVRTLAPVWEGNEVWLIAGGAVLFAGFPAVYAALFSGAYLALLFILAPLVLRGVAFEFRGKAAAPAWRRFWDWAIFAGGVLPSFLWGVATACLAGGLPIDDRQEYAGTFRDFLTPLSLAGGAAFALVFLLHGAAYLALRLDTALVPRTRAFGLTAGRYALPATLAFAGLMLAYTDLATRPAACGALAMAAVAAGFCRRCLGRRRYGRGFLLSTAAIVFLAGAVFLGLYPRFIVSNLRPDWSLTVYNAAAGEPTLRVVAGSLLAALPVVMAFEGWKYAIFRERVPVGDRSRRRLWRRLRGKLTTLAVRAGDLAAVAEALLRRLRG